jgi:uncharacterized membrane protein YfcA
MRRLVDGGHISLALALVPAALLGKIVGAAFLKRLSEKVSRTIGLSVVILAGTLGGDRPVCAV